MQITITVAELSRVLKLILGVVQNKVTIPVLSYVKIDVSGAAATASGSDLGMSIVTSFPISASADSSCSVLLPAKRVQDFLSSLGGKDRETITITNDGTAVQIKAGKFKAKVPSLPIEQFPVFEQRPPVQAVISLGTLKMLIRKVESAVPSKEGRYSIPVILLESGKNILRAVATDGFRIAIADAIAAIPEFKLFLPKIALPILSDLSGEDVEFSESETNYHFKTPTAQLLVRKSPAKFPSYEKALEKATSFPSKLTVPSGDLKLAINAVMPVVDPKDSAVDLTFDGAGDLGISATSFDGEASDSVTVLGEGTPNKVRIDPVFILDFLAQADGQPITVCLTDMKNLVKFSTDTLYQYLVMPKLQVQPAAEEKKSAKK